MFEGLNFVIVFYTLSNGMNKLAHSIGFVDAPTIQDTHDAITNVLASKLVPTDEPVYMGQLPADQAAQIFFGSAPDDGCNVNKIDG